GKTIADLMAMPVKDLYEWLLQVEFNEHEKKISGRIMTELLQRVRTLIQVGLSYLTMYRTANTLSGGESQRIQLTRFLGSNLTDSLYILDEPSIGLHPRDTDNLIKVLKSLRDLNNTVIIVEHDEMMMKASDHIIDMGPLAAHLGGEVVAAGSPEESMHNDKSLTGRYLKGTLSISATNHRKVNIQGAPKIELLGCRE